MTSDLERLRELSKLLFGSLARVEVATAVANAQPGVVDADSLTERLGYPHSKYGVVRNELLAFAKAGLLVPLPRTRGVRQKEYERLPSVYWELVREFARERAGRGAESAG